MNHEKESQKSNQQKVSVIWATEAGKQFYDLLLPRLFTGVFIRNFLEKH